MVNSVGLLVVGAVLFGLGVIGFLTRRNLIVMFLSTEVMFQEPGFSGSTGGNIQPSPNYSGIDNTTGHDDSHSVNATWMFNNYANYNWLRYTAYSTSQPEANPILALADANGGIYASSTLTFWMKGVPEPSALLLLGLGGLLIRRR